MSARVEEHCAECGATLPAGLPRGLCPRCALAGALDLGGASEFSSDLPRSFGDYELLERIAQGGMGIVYKARQKSLNRIVALKMLLFGPMASQAVIRRFRAEAVAAGSLRHPNIVAIHEVGIHDGQHFIVMDYVDGPTLASYVRNQPMPARRAAACAKTVAEAIHYAHSAGVLHRDLKPSNILMGGDDEPRVTDFGLARRMEEDSSLTLTGQAIGSPGYMPPEQAAPRHGKISARSDVYGIGATLYHLLTGHPPFQGDSVAHTLEQVLHQEPISPRLLNSGVPADLDTICLKCLQKEPERRFATACELAEELGRFLRGQPIRARPVSGAEKLWRVCKRRPAMSALTGLAALLLILVAMGGPIAAWRIRKSETALAANLYAADMKLVEISIAEGNWGRARSLLKAHEPAPGRKDTRGFEWFYFNAVARGDQTQTMQAHANMATALAMAPNGKFIASGGYDGLIKFWEYPSMRFISEIAMPGNRFVSLSFRGDGELLAATTEDFKAYVWRVSSRQLIATVPGEWTYAEFAPTGPNLALCAGRVWGDGEGPLKVWDSERKQDVRTWTDGGSRVAWSPDGKRLFSGPVKSAIASYDLESGATGISFKAERIVLSIAVSPDSKTLAAATVHPTAPAHAVQLWEIASGKTIGARQGHTANIWKICFSSDGQYLASASSDQSIRIWDAKNGHLFSTLRGHGDEVWSLIFSADGKSLISVDKKGELLTWAVPQTPKEDLNSQIAAIFGPRVFSPDGQTMAVGIGENRVALIDLKAERIQRVIERAACAIAFEDEGRVLLTLDGDGLTRNLIVENKREPPRTLTPAIQNFSVLAVSNDHRLLACENEPGRLTLWDLASGAMIDQARLDSGDPVMFLRFSPDGKQLAVVRQKAESVLLFSDALKKFRSLNGHSLEVWSVAFSSDGAMIATASMDDTVLLWDNQTGRVIGTFRGHKEGVSGIAISPDNKTLAAVCGNRSIKLWNIPTQREVGNLQYARPLIYADFSPDGQTLVGSKPWAPEARLEFWRAPR